MKKILIAGTVLVMIFLLAACAACAEDIPLTKANFPDKALREALTLQADVNGDGALSEDEQAAVTFLDVSGLGIASLRGTECFTNLTFLDCYGNSLTELDVSAFSKLESLNCAKNSILRLDVSGLKALVSLSCSGNGMAEIDLAGCTALRQLYCSDNSLQALDTAECTALEELWYDHNCLAGLDLSRNTALRTARGGNNTLTLIDRMGWVDLNTIPGFSITKASVTNAQYVNLYGNILTINGDVTLEYQYNCGFGSPQTFSIHFPAAEGPYPLAGAALKSLSMTYTGEERRQTANTLVTAEIGGEPVVLTPSTDYTIRYENNILPGTASMIITGRGMFTGTLTRTFRILPAPLYKVKLDHTEMTYSGEEKRQSANTVVTARLNGKEVTLTASKDYTIKYEDNINIGTARMIVTGKGSYTGTIVKTFKIVPKGTVFSSIRYDAENRVATVIWKKQTTETTGYQVEYSTDPAFPAGATEKVTVRDNTTNSWKLADVTQGYTWYFRIRTYRALDGVNYFSNWSETTTLETQ